MTYYKNKPKAFYQNPFFAGVVVALVLIAGMTAGYYFAKSTFPEPTPTLPAQPTTEKPKPTALETQDTQDDSGDLGIQLDIETATTANNTAIITTDNQPITPTNSPTISESASAIVANQKNSPVVWEMSQKDPTKSAGSTQTQSTPTPSQAQHTQNIQPAPTFSDSSAAIGDQSVLHADDVPAAEHASLGLSPKPPVITPRIKIESADKDETGTPTKSLEIE